MKRQGKKRQAVEAIEVHGRLRIGSPHSTSGENALPLCVIVNWKIRREKRREGPFVGHTLGPPWRLIACNAPGDRPLVPPEEEDEKASEVSHPATAVTIEQNQLSKNAVLCPARLDPHDGHNRYTRSFTVDLRRYISSESFLFYHMSNESIKK